MKCHLECGETEVKKSKQIHEQVVCGVAIVRVNQSTADPDPETTS